VDGTSTTYNFYVDVKQGGINSIVSGDPLYFVAGYSADFMVYSGGRPRKIRRMPNVTTASLEVNRNAIAMWRALVRIGLAENSTDTAIKRGVFSWGSLHDEVTDTLSFDHIISTGTKTVERILRIAYANFSIGTSMTDSLGTSDIRQHLEDGERYINGILEDTVNTPISPAPNSLKFASDYLGAYFTYTNAFSANKPDAPSEVVMSWKTMAEKVLDSYKKGYQSGDANVAGWTSATAIFNSRGVKGISDGLLEDSKDIKSHNRK